MNAKKFFRFENPDEDFPFYNDNPRLEKWQWMLLLSGLIVLVAYMSIFNDIPKHINSTIIFLIMIVPIAIVTRGRLGILFKRPRAKDVVLVLALLVGYYIYSLLMAIVLFKMGITPTPNKVLSQDADLMLLFGMLVQLIGEELIKIISFLMIAHVLYTRTQNRKASIIVALFISLIFFGLLHYKAYNGNFAQMILIIGLGSFFNMFAYLKTKNATVSYMYHIILDLLAVALSALLKGVVI